MIDDILAKYPGVRGRPEAMAMLCAVLRDKGLLDDALLLGEAAVAAAPDSLAVDLAVRDVLAKGVPSFHRPLLLDDRRNAAYAAAIARMVKPGMKVLEIGCGAGLLAMLAARAGAEVVTCEVNPLVAAAAREVIRRNGLADRIRVIAKLSTTLTIPEDLAEPADLVIHEVFGARLFDEGVTESLTDARQRLLKPGAPSIPAAASLRLALVREAGTRQRRTLADVEGFDLSAFELLAPQRPWLNSARRDGVEICSAPASGLGMDYDRAPPFGPATETVSLVSNGGRIDGVMQWLAIDFGNGILHENQPLVDGEPSSWGVPLFRFKTSIDTLPGDRIELTLRHRGTLLLVDAAKRSAA